jgi:enolase-phosphatase E1
MFLLDIEGTTSSVSFVYETLFPYVRKALPEFLRDHWTHAPMQKACEQIAKDAGAASFAEWAGTDELSARQAKLLQHLYRLMDADSKATGLKELQGLISRIGYAAGTLRSHVYPDVPPALKRWTESGRKVAIFSSGSIAAQKQFYKNTEAGDLSGYLSGHFDTTTGPKREAESYRKIAAALAVPPAEIVFISDVVEELDAAKVAGIQAILALRPGNKPVRDGHGHKTIISFDEVK